QKKIIIYFVIVSIIAGSIGTWFCTRDRLPDAIRIASGSTGGEYYKFGDALEKKLSSRTSRPVKNIKTAGTLENLRLLKEGKVEVALLQSIVFPDLDDDASNSISVIAPLYFESVIILAKKISGIESVYDLENRRVCTGVKESGTEKTSDDLLDFYGLKKVKRVHESFHDNSSHSDRNSCDAGIMVMGLRGPCLQEMGKTDMRVLELPYVKALAESEAFLAEFTLPEGVFARHPLPTLPHKNIQTVAYTALLAVRKGASSALVNKVLDAVYRTDLRINFPDLLPLKEVRGWSEIPLDQTAQEYYNPLRRMEVFATRMEAFAAVKELFFAFLAISYFFWLRFNELRRKEERIQALKMKEELDVFLQETIALDRKQMQSESPEELRSIIDQITEIKIKALEELTNEQLQSDQMFSIFLIQCHNLIFKIQNKIGSLR
ncbi:MAG: TAXI family TRAP transporter solute-binding subunit, partial [Candidatus Electrothrix sp. AR1]|nr:TAXI family TRAP transporter solute-binding subunit [Candidatus Electrothrix sp. AR1]